jgi:hypothetical protein
MAREPAPGVGDEDPVARTLRAMVLAFEELDQAAESGDYLGEVFARVVSVAQERTPGAAAVSVSAFVRGDFMTVAASNEQARRADELQRLTRGGPCLDTLFSDPVYNPQDLAHDPRWPEFGRRLSSELALRSMLSYRLLDGSTVRSEDAALHGARAWASLNIYGIEPHGFDENAVMTGLLLATHARAAVKAGLARHQIEHLEQLLRHSGRSATSPAT